MPPRHPQPPQEQEDKDNDENDDDDPLYTDASFPEGGVRQWLSLIASPAAAGRSLLWRRPSATAAHFARERRDQGVLRRTLSGWHVWVVALS
jgi:hypothetical protein